MPKLVNRAKMTTSTTGTGVITLGSAVGGYQSFADAGVSDGDVVRYVIEDGTDWEIGTGTYTASGTTLSRTVSESSNSGAAITLSGSAEVFVGAVNEDLFGSFLGTVSSNDLDLSTGTVFEVTTDNQTLTFSNAPDVKDFKIKLTGAGTIAGFDLSVASYDSVSLSVTSEETGPQGITFNSSGTKMYIVGSNSDSVHQYSLSTAFDLSTASYDSVSFSVSSEETVPREVLFNTSGTKMYIVGSNSDSVHQYSLSTAFDLSTASYDSVSFSVSSEDGAPQGLSFNSSGSKLYVAGGANDSVYQYSLSTAFDLSTASYDSVSLFVGSEDGAPQGLSFNSDGTKMFVLGSANDSVYQYSLSTAFDLSTASYDSVSFSVSSEETVPQGLAFSGSGEKMYVVGGVNDTVFQYSTSTETEATITYPTSVKFPGGTAPTAPAVGDVDTIGVYTVDGGTTYYGYQLGDAHS